MVPRTGYDYGDIAKLEGMSFARHCLKLSREKRIGALSHFFAYDR